MCRNVSQLGRPVRSKVDTSNMQHMYRNDYVSVQLGCLKFLDSYRFLPFSLGKVIKKLDCFPIMDSNIFKERIIKKEIGISI